MTEPAHYPHGPSGAHRWLICTDSPHAEAGYANETTDASDEGTAAHWLLEQCLKDGLPAQEWVDQRCPDKIIPADEFTGCEKDWPVTGEMIEAVQTHLDEVARWAGFPKLKRGARLWAEERVHVPEHYRLLSPVGGTADTIIYLMRSKTLVVLDFKYGKGHVVEVGSDKWSVNPQIGLYAIAALCELERLLGKKVEVKWIELAIIQPRAYHKKGPVRIKKISPMQLMGLEMDLIEAVNGPKVRVAGDHCHFCRAKPDCAEYHAHRGEQATGGFEAEVPAGEDKPEWVGVDHADGADAAAYALVGSHHHELAPAPPSLPELIARPVKSLTLDELARARALLAPLKAWAKEVEEEVRTRWLHDLPVPGTKLVQGPGKRAFGGTPDEVRKAAISLATDLGVPLEDLYEPAELKSPAKLEKQLGKAKFKDTALANLIVKTEGGPVVADEDSDKPAYVKNGGFEAEVPPETIDSPLL